jgi:hypothetical protein
VPIKDKSIKLMRTLKNNKNKTKKHVILFQQRSRGGVGCVGDSWVLALCNHMRILLRMYRIIISKLFETILISG